MYLLWKKLFGLFSKIKEIKYSCKKIMEVRSCVKSVQIRSFSGPYFPTFGLNSERYGVSLRIQSECGKMRKRITPNTDTFYAVCNQNIFRNIVYSEPEKYSETCQASIWRSVFLMNRSILRTIIYSEPLVYFETMVYSEFCQIYMMR